MRPVGYLAHLHACSGTTRVRDESATANRQRRLRRDAIYFGTLSGLLAIGLMLGPFSAVAGSALAASVLSFLLLPATAYGLSTWIERIVEGICIDLEILATPDVPALQIASASGPISIGSEQPSRRAFASRR